MARNTNGDRRWRVRGVSVQGYSHLRDGIECQDALRHAYEPTTGGHVLAVADGAGSRARSADGAAVAVGLAVGELCERLSRSGVPRTVEAWHGWLEEGLRAIVAAFLDVTERLGGSSSDFAATLTVAVLAPPWLATASIGDGIVIVGADGDDGESGLHLVTFAPPGGEYVNETRFLSSAGALDDARVQVLEDPGLTTLILATDGVVPIAVQRDGDARRPNRTFLEPVLRSLVAPRSDPTAVSRLLLEERISRQSADDKTLLAAVRT
jgi:hypothetical protein